VHFRLRKNVIQLIRTTYNESKKKGDNVIVGTVKLNNPVLCDELREKLKTEEISAFESWLASQHRTEMLRAELAALTLAQTMLAAQTWFERETDLEQARASAADIMNAWQSLRRVLAKKILID
jgi:hypothetical protein